MAAVIIEEGLAYTKSNRRLRYNPALHENHGKPYTKDDLIYLCTMWDSRAKADIAAALGKTHSSVLNKKWYLNKIGLFEHYKKLGKDL